MLKRIWPNNKEALFHISALIILGAYLFPFFSHGSDLYLMVFDNLDSNVVWLKILAQSNKIFASNSEIIPNMMDGLPRSTYGSEFNVLLWLYYLFSPFTAYAINEVVIHLMAYFSMFIFLKDRLGKKKDALLLSFLGAIVFALLPFWPSAGISISVMPLVTYVFLKIENHADRWQHWLILIIFPFYSSFILIYVFYFSLMAIYFIKKNMTYQFNKRFLFSLLLVVSLFLLIEYRLLIQVFTQEFISNRTEYYSLIDNTFLESYREALLQFLNGTPHSKGTHFKILLPLAIFTLFISLFPRSFNKTQSLLIIIVFLLSLNSVFWDIILLQKYSLLFLGGIFFSLSILKRSPLATLLSIQLLIGIWFGFSFYEEWNSLLDKLKTIKMFNFSRYFFFSQILWSITLVLTLQQLISKVKFSILYIPLILISQYIYSTNSALFSTTSKTYYQTWNNYYAPDIFKNIQESINKPQNSYRVLSLGLDPAISLYNGFYTLDGYCVNYPLEYKHKFRKIITDSLAHEKYYRDLFDGWGSKLYLFDKNVEFIYYNELHAKASKSQIYKNLDFNTTQLKCMGGDYIISAGQIDNYRKYNLRYISSHTKENSIWKINLYQIVD